MEAQLLMQHTVDKSKTAQSPLRPFPASFLEVPRAVAMTVALSSTMIQILFHSAVSSSVVNVKRELRALFDTKAGLA